MKVSEFVLDYAHSLHYKCHKVCPNRGGSCMHSPDWIKNTKAIINPINIKYNKCFQYAVAVAFYHEGKNPERIIKINPFVNKYKWEEINFPSEKDDWKRFEKNNVTIAFNVLYAKKKESYPAYVRKITQIIKSKLFF